MKQYRYTSYEHYKTEQIRANKKKLNCSYVDPNSIYMLCTYAVDMLNLTPENVLCHGTRRGLEQTYFSKGFSNHGLHVTVIGTEISQTATRFPDTVQWDFHEPKDEWKGAFDIVYSNSFDHAFNPVLCLDTWMGQVTGSGICIIEYSHDMDSRISSTDPFGATLQEYKELITEKYEIVDILDNKGIPDDGETFKGQRLFLLIRNPSAL